MDQYIPGFDETQDMSNYDFNMKYYGDSGGESPYGNYRTTQPVAIPTTPISSFAGSPMFGGGGSPFVPGQSAGFSGAGAAAPAAMAGPVGGGVAGSGLLDPTEFNLEVKDKLAKKDGEDKPKEVGGLSSISSLPEGIRMALARLGGQQGGAMRSMHSQAPQGQVPNEDMQGSALRQLMARKMGAQR